METPEKIQDIKNWLKQLDFPKIGFLESLSLTDDGGKEAIEIYEDSDKRQFASENDIPLPDQRGGNVSRLLTGGENLDD